MVDGLFGSKTRVKLLHLFLSNPDRAFYVREITRKIDEQINSVRRELANMLAVGIIKSEGSSNRLYYEVNQEYQHYQSFKNIFDETDPVSGVDSGDWNRRLKVLGDLRVAILSGSLVHGSKSDIDVLLVGNVNKTQSKKFLKQLESDEGRSLNYTVMDYSDFRYRLNVKDKFIAAILSGKHTVLLDSDEILQ